MKKLLTASIITIFGFAAANAAIIKLDTSNGIATSTFTAAPSGTTYTIIDVATSPAAVNGVVTLSASNEYILDNITFVENGVLKIEAGTIIRGELRSSSTLNDPGALVITRTARIDAQGTPADPIIFTTAAVDDVAPIGEPDGVIITVFNPAGADNSYFTKEGTQWTPGATFLDSAPKSSPLAPTASFATDPVGVAPIAITTDGDGDLTSFIELVSENRSLWGGIVILGNAPTSIGKIVGDVVADTDNGDLAGDILDEVFEGFIEGFNIVEAGQLGVYGGFNPNDSSGILRYVSIRHGGSIIDDANEINGLTMGGVGRGTLIENIEVYCNGDDGYEWFGGTVDTKNLISLWNNDDSFDIDEGYTGRGQFWFSLQGDDLVNGDHGGEHDGTDANHDSVDIEGFGPGTGSNDAGLGLAPAYITVYNATYIGGGVNGNTGFTDSGANRAFRIRDGFSGIYRNSIFASFKDTPVRDNDSDNTGFFTLENNIFYGVNSGDTYTIATLLTTGAVPTNWTLKEFDAITDPSGNTLDEDVFAERRDGFLSITAAKFDRRGLYNTTVDNDPDIAGIQNSGFDPRPDSASAPSVTSNLAGSLPTFFRETTYKGAFSPTATNLNIWTGSALGGGVNPSWSVFGTSFLDLQ